MEAIFNFISKINEIQIIATVFFAFLFMKYLEIKQKHAENLRQIEVEKKTRSLESKIQTELLNAFKTHLPKLSNELEKVNLELHKINKGFEIHVVKTETTLSHHGVYINKIDERVTTLEKTQRNN